MGQRSGSNNAAVKGAQIKPKMVEYALGMVRRRLNANDASVKDAQTKLSEEEYV